MSSTTRASMAAIVSFVPFVCTCSLGACTSNPYFIGASCPGESDASAVCSTAGATGAAGGNGGGAASTAGNGSDLSFALDLDQTGASHLKSELQLAGGSIDATLRFRGETATAQDWPSDQGALLVKSLTAPVVQLEAPFTDGTRAVGFATSSATYVAQNAEPGAVDSDDFALELVLRAVPGASIIGKRDARAGWSVTLAASGALTLEVRDEQRTLHITSELLVPRAWYHCLFWVSRAAGGQVFCNGRAGSVTDLRSLGSLGSAATLTVGGGAPETNDSSELAHFSLFRTPDGLGAADTWPPVSRRRFAELTGVSPRVARGSVLPEAGLRDSAAYLDLQRGFSASRHLFLVGPDWPRVTCRAAPPACATAAT